MTQDERMQVYLEMSKKSTMDYLYEYRASLSKARDEDFVPPTDDDMMAIWNACFERTCKRLGLKP
jgi:uncharacterized protein YyaL (SSP411 family)